MDNTAINFDVLQKVPEERWELLAQKKLFFGHQSVGYNIMKGVSEIRDKIQIVIIVVRGRHIE